MTTTTLRPNGSNSVGFAPTFVGGATYHAVTSDDSDASYAEHWRNNCNASVNFGTYALPAGAVTKQIRWRARWRLAGGAGQDFGMRVESTGTGLLYYDETTVPGTSWTDFDAPYTPVTLTQTQIDGLFLRTYTPDADANDYNVAELFIDLVTVAQPLAGLDALPAGSAVTQVPVSWSPTLEADGGAQTRYELRVFDEATYGAGFPGLDIDADTPYWSSGEVLSAAESTTTGPLEDGDTYRIALRVAQTVNGVAHWSDWDTDDTTVTVATAEVSDLIVTPNAAEARLEILVNRDTGEEDWDFVDLERSFDAGTTWEPVRGGTLADAPGNLGVLLYDYETPNGADTLYRARAVRDVGGDLAYGSWVEASSAAAWSEAVDVWLKDPTDPAKNLVICPRDRGEQTRQRRAGVFQVLGVATPVAVTDVMGAPAGSMTTTTRTEADYDALAALLESSGTLLLQWPPSLQSGQQYLAALNVSDAFYRQERTNGYRRVWSFDYVETAAPPDTTGGA